LAKIFYNFAKNYNKEEKEEKIIIEDFEKYLSKFDPTSIWMECNMCENINLSRKESIIKQTQRSKISTKLIKQAKREKNKDASDIRAFIRKSNEDYFSFLLNGNWHHTIVEMVQGLEKRKLEKINSFVISDEALIYLKELLEYNSLNPFIAAPSLFSELFNDYEENYLDDKITIFPYLTNKELNFLIENNLCDTRRNDG
jgi:hypothetical protein